MSLGTDLPIILRWWLTMLLVGWTMWPLLKRTFTEWDDQGYLWSKVLGIAALSWGVMVLNFFGLANFSILTMTLIMGVFLGLGWMLNKRTKGHQKTHISKKSVLTVEIIFLITLVFWSWIKGHAPDINGLEKFMDYGFSRSIMRSNQFPPADMWYAGESINYYYFGHYYMAVLTTLSGIDLGYSFNLMLATLFAFCFTGSFVIGKHLLRGEKRTWQWVGAILIAFLVSLSGNLHTIYSFTKGYAGSEENPPPFWTIFNNPLNKDEFEQGWKSYWYPNATRFIPFTIHEFPSYSFVVSDIHGHVLSIPFALLAVALIINLFGRDREDFSTQEMLLYGSVCGILFMTNALDGPIYVGLMGLLLFTKNWKGWHESKLVNLSWELLKKISLTLVAVVVVVLPFIVHFKPFVSGVAINCPPEFLAHKTSVGGEEFNKFGPFIFEGVEKCQKSPVWMMLVLWGFFLYCGLGLGLLKSKGRIEGMMTVWSWYAFGLIIFAEFFYFKDIYPQHFRSNTMFKLGYQAFMMMSIVSGYVIVQALKRKMKLFVLGVIPLLVLVSIYPYFSVKSYFGELKTYYGLNGLSWLHRQLPDDAALIDWLNNKIESNQQPVVLEANGDSYTEYERVSTFTGLPTVAGWTVHEWLWRGGYTPIAERAGEVKTVYENPDTPLAQEIIKKYKVEYIVVGNLEKQKYENLNEEGIKGISEPVFRHGLLTLYKVNLASF